MDEYLNNPHPGEILLEEFLNPMNMSQSALAKAIGVPANRINAIIRSKRNISADTELRLSRFFGLSEGYWLRLQNAYDIMKAHRESGESIRNIKPCSACI